jgi:hypothetical protein
MEQYDSGGKDMRKWTWQWFILLAILGMLFSCGAWIDRQPYDIYEDVYKPDRPWKQMIWKASVAVAKEDSGNG